MWVLTLALCALAFLIMVSNPAPEVRDEEESFLSILGPVFCFWVVLIAATVLYLIELSKLF